MLPLTICLWTIITLSACAIDRKFPPWFKFGSASSSFQVEGAWNVSGKAETKWDHLVHTFPYIVGDLSTADVACDSYHQWERDIEMISQLGLQYYRFSISWPRLLPNGFSNYINEEAKTYYNNLINGLLAKGIEPLITMHHYELPQIFQDLGGWTNPLMPNWFEDYARVVFSLFANRVKTWITINEPQIDCDLYHRIVGKETLGLEHSLAVYLCSKYILIAHAKAWRVYDQEFRPKYNGKLSISNHLLWLAPQSPKDEALTETARQFISGSYSHAIYSKKGGWPPIVEEIVEKVSKKMGYSRSLLPYFTEEEIELIKGTYDFYGMNHYTSRLVRPKLPTDKEDLTLFLAGIPEINALFSVDPSWHYGYNNLMPINPAGIRHQMHWLREQYGDIEIVITENGFSSTGSNLKDYERIAFIEAHLEQVLLSIQEGINVTRYTYWSLMDSFEFFDGYRSKFGLYEVDFMDINRKRTPRKSASYYKNVISCRSLSCQ